MKRKSAGILLYKFENNQLKVLLAHPGGPFWSRKDEGAWTIPKGEFDESEVPIAAAIRELDEETGIKASGNFIELSPVRLKSGKIIYAWALEMEADPSELKSNVFEMEWPPRSGKKKSFPEIDKMEWFDPNQAKKKINEGQQPLLDNLSALLA